MSSFVSICFLVLCAAGCGSTEQYNAPGLVPAEGADATITVETGEAGNQRLRVLVEHLPPPDRFAGELSSYAVWIIPDGRDAELVGILEYDAEARRGTLETTTPFRMFEVLVTAEAERRPEMPGGTVVVRQNVEPAEG